MKCIPIGLGSQHQAKASLLSTSPVRYPIELGRLKDI